MFVVLLPEARIKYKRKSDQVHHWNASCYLVRHFESYSETGEGYVVLVNDVGEIWWVSNRDVRAEWAYNKNKKK